MMWCRIRLVLLGLLLCVVHVVSGTCGQSFTDPSSSALLADVVIEGKVRKTSDPDPEGTYNITVAVRKNIFKGGNFINKGRPAKTVTIDRFKTGDADENNCFGSVQKGRTYLFFLRNTADPKGLYFEIMALPVKKSKKITSELKKVLCESCAKIPSISELSGPETVTTESDITLKCVIQGNPMPVFSWYKDGVLFQNNKGKYRINSRKRQSTLQIKLTKVKDSGVYECVAKNVLGEARKNFSLTVLNPKHMVPCVAQTYCLNGGTCMHIAYLSISYCQCPRQYQGERCEEDTGHGVLVPLGQASLMLERTLVIIGIVIAVLVFIVICIVSYILAKRGRKRFEQRRKRREAQRTEQNRPAVCVDSRNATQTATYKESEMKNESIQPNSAPKQLRQIMLQDSSSPPVHQPSHGNFSEFPQQLQHSEVKINPNGNRSELRGRLAASSVYDNFKNSEPSHFIDSGAFHKNIGTTAAAPSENIEMRLMSESKKENTTVDHTDKDHADVSLTNGIRPTDLVDQPLSPPPPKSSEPSPPFSPYTYFSETRPLPIGSSVGSPFEPLAPSLVSPSQDPTQRFTNNIFSLNENDTAVQPLLPNHNKHLPMHRYVQPQRPFESKSDKDLSQYLPLGSKRQGSYDVHGYKNDIKENNRLLTDLSKLSHSNTFPKSKVNGLSSDTFSESDEEDASEVPYEKQLDLYISEDDLDLSKENLVSSSFSSMNTPSRQASREERGIGALSNSGLSRPGIRKHQSEEGSGYKFANKSHAFLQDNARSHSLDNPPGRADVNPDPKRLNSTVAGSPEVETYDNIVQQLPHLPNHTYAYDPNDDSAPWDREINRTDNRSSLTEDDKDRIHRLKDVLPDQQAIPI